MDKTERLFWILISVKFLFIFCAIFAIINFSRIVYREISTNGLKGLVEKVWNGNSK